MFGLIFYLSSVFTWPFTKIQISKEVATRLSIYFREVTAAKHV